MTFIEYCAVFGAAKDGTNLTVVVKAAAAAVAEMAVVVADDMTPLMLRADMANSG